jgi:MoaA/NifB/PqqE/SkfB family radical SAM enzyme
MSFFKKLCDLNIPIRLLTSFHYERANLDEYYKNLIYLLKKGIDTKILVMWDFKYKDQIREIYYRLKKLENNYNCFCSLDMVYTKKQYFSKEDLNWYYNIQNENKHYIVYNVNGELKTETTSYNRVKIDAYNYHKHKVNFKFHRCDCGIKNLFIESNGDVHYCRTMAYNKRKPIFNLLIDDYKQYLHIFKNNIVCTEDSCYSETSIPKYKVLKNVGHI